MLQCCSAQREFIKQSITHNIRIDGRNTQTRRSLVIKSDVITHLPGSSYIYLMY
jgi:exosome complex RNA-binding protein Rrp42 (RNase PH superfamily)